MTNSILDEAELYLERPGLESMAILNDDIILTGDQTGSVLKVVGKHVAEHITTLKYPCDENPFVDSLGKSTCGWPLGMRLNKGELYLMDNFGGLTKVNIKTGLLILNSLSVLR